MFRQNVLEGMLADPSYGGNNDMVGWKWVGFPGDPMRRGDLYARLHLHQQDVPVRDKPLPLMPKGAKAGVASGSAATGSKTPANADTNKSMGGM